MIGMRIKMGVKLSELVDGKEIDIEYLRGKTLAVDAFNMLYQFITTIRQPDGSPLTDSDGRTTSHLIGLFYRLTNLLKREINLIFVFDGESHALKSAEQDKRSEVKKEAEKRYKEAVEAEDTELMKKYASRTSRLTKDMIEESKEILDAMGIPFIEAPSEGEAQCAKIVRDGNAYAVMSQDADSMLFGAPRIVKNLSITQRKKRKDKLGSERTFPVIITLADVLNRLEIDQEKLIVMGILIGTDFNPGGIKGIGPKKALKIVKENDDLDDVFMKHGWEEHFSFGWKEVYDIFKESHSKEDYKIEWKKFDKLKIMKILVEKHDFSEQRISDVCDEVIGSYDREQKGLDDFL